MIYMNCKSFLHIDINTMYIRSVKKLNVIILSKFSIDRILKNKNQEKAFKVKLHIFILLSCIQSFDKSRFEIKDISK